MDFFQGEVYVYLQAIIRGWWFRDCKRDRKKKTKKNLGEGLQGKTAENCSRINLTLLKLIQAVLLPPSERCWSDVFICSPWLTLPWFHCGLREAPLGTSKPHGQQPGAGCTQGPHPAPLCFRRSWVMDTAPRLQNHWFISSEAKGNRGDSPNRSPITWLGESPSLWCSPVQHWCKVDADPSRAVPAIQMLLSFLVDCKMFTSFIQTFNSWSKHAASKFPEQAAGLDQRY